MYGIKIVNKASKVERDDLSERFSDLYAIPRDFFSIIEFIYHVSFSFIEKE